MKKIIYALLFSFLFFSCSPKLQRNGKFKSDVKAETLKSTPYELDAYKLVIVPDDFLEYFLKMDYFKGVMTYSTAQKMVKVKDHEQFSYKSFSKALKDHKKDTDYLIVESALEVGLERHIYLNLINPKDETSLFSAQIKPRSTFVRNQLGLFNNLMEYLDNNSLHRPERSREEILVPSLRYGFKFTTFLNYPRDENFSDGGIDLGFFGEYRFNRNLAVQMEIMPGLAFFNKIDFSLNTPLLLKWRPSNNFDIHGGLEFNYYSKGDEIVYLHTGDRHPLKKQAWNTTVGIGYDFLGSSTFVVRYSRGINTRGDWSYLGPQHLDSFSFGFEFEL